MEDLFLSLSYKWGVYIVNPAVDTVSGFVQGNNLDKLDFQSLLVGEDNSSLSNYLSFNYSGANTTISIRPNGDSEMTQQVIISGIDLTSGNTLTDLEIINNLLDDNQLIIDS